MSIVLSAEQMLRSGHRLECWVTAVETVSYCVVLTLRIACHFSVHRQKNIITVAACSLDHDRVLGDGCHRGH